MSRNFTLTLLLGIFIISASPTLFAQTPNPPVITNLDGDVINYQSYNGVRLDNGNAQVTAGGMADLSRAVLRVRFTQGRVPAEDRIRAININMPTGVVANSGNNLFFNGQYIGSVKGVDPQWEFIVQFEQHANAEAIAAVIRSLVYVNANPDNPTLQTREITFTLNDGFGNVSTPVTVTLNVPGGNRPPIGVDKYYNAGANLTLTVPANMGLLSTEVDPEGSALSFSLTQTALHGTITTGASGQFTYLPTTGFTGLDSITYNVCDVSGACTFLKAIFFVAGSGANIPPDAEDDRFYMARDQVLYINRSWSVLLSDSDPNSGSVRIFNAATLVSGPANGTVKLYADGSFRYVPNPGFSGTDQFVYSNCDRQGGCDQATIRIDVSSNTPPLAIHDRLLFAGEIENGNVLTNDSDPEGDNLTASLVTAPVNGTVVLNADGSFTYTANAGHFGLDSLIYQVCDNGTPSLCDTAVLSLWRLSNIRPVITVPGTQSVPVNTNLTFSNNISIADADAAPADLLKMKLTVANGTLTLPVTAGLIFTTGSGNADVTSEFTGTLANINNALNTVVYTPTSNFNSIDSLKLLVNDQFAADPMEDSAKVAIIVGQQEPVVTHVTSPNNDGWRIAGDTLSVQVIFNKPVAVTGTPQLLLETGATDRYALYTKGSSSNVLFFLYQVQPGDENPDLDYLSTAALELAGGTISNTAGTYNAILTLPAPGSPASVAGSKSIMIDGNPPAVTSIDWPADGLYKAGDVLTFTLHISEDITAASSTLPVTIGATTVQAALTASAARTLTYSYTILNNELDADGIAVTSPSGTITDIAGNALTALTAAQRPGVLVDAIPPVVTAGQVFIIAENAVAGTAIGNIAATDAGAVKPLQNWLGATAPFSLNAATGALSLTGELNYETNTSFDLPVTVTDGINISTVQMVRINVLDVNEAPVFNTIPNVTPCAGGPESQLTVTGITPGPETAQTVTLSISTDRDIFNTLTIDNTGLIRYALKADATGTATITVTAKDNGGTANGGTDTYTRSFTASIGTGPAISITSNKGNKISKGDIAILTATGAGTYEWDSGERTESISVRPFQKTTYHVKGTAANGCISEGSFELDINEDFKLDATNIVTPNGDGINDRWVIRNIDAYPNNEVKIFDRSGRLIYEKKGYINDWGGTANGKPLQDGTYYYILDFGPGLPKFKGYITVIRDIK